MNLPQKNREPQSPGTKVGKTKSNSLPSLGTPAIEVVNLEDSRVTKNKHRVFSFNRAASLLRLRY